MAYLVSLLASLVVSLTVTPVLASLLLLLLRARFMEERRDPFLLRGLKWLDARLLPLLPAQQTKESSWKCILRSMLTNLLRLRWQKTLLIGLIRN